MRARRDLKSGALACFQRRRRGPIHDDDERALAIGAVAPRAPDLNDTCGPGHVFVRVCVRVRRCSIVPAWRSMTNGMSRERATPTSNTAHAQPSHSHPPVDIAAPAMSSEPAAAPHPQHEAENLWTFQHVRHLYPGREPASPSFASLALCRRSRRFGVPASRRLLTVCRTVPGCRTATISPPLRWSCAPVSSGRSCRRSGTSAWTPFADG